MSKIDSILEEYLVSRGLVPTRLGAETEPRETVPPEAASDRLTWRLQEHRRATDRLMTANAVMLAVLFALGVFFALYYRDDPATLAAIFGGTFLSLLVIVRYQHRLWRDKNTMDILIDLADNMAPGEVFRVLETIFYSRKRAQGAQRLATAAS